MAGGSFWDYLAQNLDWVDYLVVAAVVVTKTTWLSRSPGDTQRVAKKPVSG